MPADESGIPDALKYEDWAGEMGERWLRNLASFEGTIAPMGEALLAHAAFRPGERVLDVGCGGGATTLAIARAVAPGGEALGIDISPDLVAAATRRAADAGVGNARFLCADAASVALPDAPYDRLVSRFGSMFFADPVPAFAHLRGLLRPGGRIDLAVWGPPRANPWMLEAMAVARRHVELPAPVPRAPGPFAFEDRDYLAETLAAAGFANVEIASYSDALPVGGPDATPPEAATFAMNAMAFGQVILSHDAAIQQAARCDLEALFARHHSPGKGVLLGGAIWLATATA